MCLALSEHKIGLIRRQTSQRLANSRTFIFNLLIGLELPLKVDEASWSRDYLRATLTDFIECPIQD